MKFVLVFVGGGAGCVARYALSLVLPRAAGFPWATFIANVVACLIIGALAYALKDRVGSTGSLLLATGFCGGLSTFSTFSLETIDLVNKGQLVTAGLYIVSSLMVCLLAVWALSKTV